MCPYGAVTSTGCSKCPYYTSIVELFYFRPQCCFWSSVFDRHQAYDVYR